MSRACRLSGTRGSPSAPTKIASKSSRSTLYPSGGIVTPVAEIVVGAPGQMLERRCRAGTSHRGVEHLDRFGGDFLADAVAGDDRDAARVRHAGPVPRPQVTQNFQLISSSEPQAGQRWIARFCPQVGQ